MTWAFESYLKARCRLPKADFGTEFTSAETLSDIAAPFGLILLDAYGVLNVGEMPIPGAAESIADLRRLGKKVMVVSNSAGYPKQQMMQRYERLGFEFSHDEVITSREALLDQVVLEPKRLWGLMLNPDSGIDEFEGLETIFLGDSPDAYDRAQGFLLVGSDGWTETRQTLLERSLRANPRPVFVGNPDIVAPREHGLSLEPGYFAHRIATETGVQPRFFGKPFDSIFSLALNRSSPDIDPKQVLMVGDTLHTDVLGGRQAGFATALVTDYGLFAGADISSVVKRSGIVPDFVINRIGTVRRNRLEAGGAVG